jgi:hypothetical protein
LSAEWKTARPNGLCWVRPWLASAANEMLVTLRPSMSSETNVRSLVPPCLTS